MKKKDIIAAFEAARVSVDQTLTVPQLIELANKEGVTLAEEPAPEEAKPKASKSNDDELIAAKVAAGLRYEQAVEVVARQRAADAAK